MFENAYTCFSSGVMALDPPFVNPMLVFTSKNPWFRGELALLLNTTSPITCRQQNHMVFGLWVYNLLALNLRQTPVTIAPTIAIPANAMVK